MTQEEINKQFKIKYKSIPLTHADKKVTVFVLLGTLSFWWWSEKHKATHIFTEGANVFPCLETPEELEAIKNQAIKEILEEV